MWQRFFIYYCDRRQGLGSRSRMGVEIRNQFVVEDHLASLSLEWNRLVGRIHGGAAIRLGATILGDDTIAQQTVKTN